MDRSLVAAVARLPEVAALVVTDPVGALLPRITIAGAHDGCVIAIDDREVLGVYVDPSQALEALESQLDMARGR
jgi:hypothetical protein